MLLHDEVFSLAATPTHINGNPELTMPLEDEKTVKNRGTQQSVSIFLYYHNPDGNAQ